jgi:hypothetical protein
MKILSQLFKMHKFAPTLYFCLLFLLLAEGFMILIGPILISNRTYLRLYLGKAASESTRRFLADKDEFLVYDPIVGWHNRPNVSRDKWQTDELGSRSAHRFDLVNLKPRRILFLGDSRVNGGTGVKGDETISAYSEDSLTQTINLGTMLYSLDQIYLAYISNQYCYDANFVVVGIQGDVEPGLINRYIPFRDRYEVNMPYFKPRFELSDTGVVLLPQPSKAAFERILDSADLLDTIKTTDKYYSKFAEFRQFGLTPIASGVWFISSKIRNLWRLANGETGISPLEIELLRHMKKTVTEHNASLIFIVFPEQRQTFPSWWRAKMPDYYRQMVIELIKDGYKILDARQVLRDSHRMPWELYASDGIHLKPEGNRILANALRILILSDTLSAIP